MYASIEQKQSEREVNISDKGVKITHQLRKLFKKRLLFSVYSDQFTAVQNSSDYTKARFTLKGADFYWHPTHNIYLFISVISLCWIVPQNVFM